jgi:hypothetical protein
MGAYGPRLSCYDSRLPDLLIDKGPLAFAQLSLRSFLLQLIFHVR